MFRFHDLPIRRKVTLLILFTSATALLLVSGAMAVYEVTRFRHTLLRELSIEAEIVAANSAAALAFSDATAAREILKGLSAQPGIVHAGLFTPNGKLFAEFKSAMEKLPALTSAPPGSRFEKGYVLVFRHVKFGEDLVGSIALRSDLREQNARLKASASIALVALLTALFVALALSIKLQKLISSPVLELAEVAHQVTLEKNYSLRAKKRSNDEIGLLMEEFNQMLAQIEKHDADLRASEERFRQLAESIHEVFWMVDLKFTALIYVSPAYEQVWGRSCASLYASINDWIESIHVDDRERIYTSFVNIAESGEANEEYRIMRPDGTIRWIHDRGFPVRDEHGNIYRIAGIAEDITKAKEVAATLERVEANYRSIFENAIDGIFQTTPDGRYLAANPAMARMLGYETPEELISGISNLGAEICVRPESRVELHQRLIAEGQVREFENQLYRKDGGIIWISLNARIVRDDDGAVLYYEGTTKDITAQKRAERQASAFSTLATQLSAAATPKEAAGCIMDAADELFGWDCGFVHLYDREHDCLWPILSFDVINGKRTEIAPENFPRPSSLTRLIVEKGALLINRQNRDSLPVVFAPFGDASRLSTSMIYAVIRQSANIIGIVSIQRYSTNLFQTEDLNLLQALADHCSGALQRIQITEQLREAEAKYREIFENATEGIFQTTPAGNYLRGNPALAHMFGYDSPEELLTKVSDIERQTYVLPERRGELKRLLETHGAVQAFEAERYRKDGSKFWISINGRVVRDEKGAVLYYEGTTRDITARRHLEKQLIEISDREKSRMGQDLHDGLCQQLVRTAFAANLLEQDLSIQFPAHVEQAKKVSRFVDDAITQSRNLARGLYPVKLEVEGLHSAMHELAENISSAYHLNCEFESSESISISDHAVATHLYRIAQEGAINAVKHAKPTRIQIRLQQIGDRIQLTVSDDGRGIPATGMRANGMGLQIMNYRAGMIGASLKVEGQPDGGTIVSCTFEQRNGVIKTINQPTDAHP